MSGLDIMFYLRETGGKSYGELLEETGFLTEPSFRIILYSKLDKLRGAGLIEEAESETDKRGSSKREKIYRVSRQWEKT